MLVSLIAGQMGYIYHRYYHCCSAVNCAITFLFLVYSGTPLNEQPLTADTNDLTKILKVLNISP